MEVISRPSRVVGGPGGTVGGIGSQGISPRMTSAGRRRTGFLTSVTISSSSLAAHPRPRLHPAQHTLFGAGMFRPPGGAAEAAARGSIGEVGLVPARAIDADEDPLGDPLTARDRDRR